MPCMVMGELCVNHYSTNAWDMDWITVVVEVALLGWHETRDKITRVGEEKSAMHCLGCAHPMDVGQPKRFWGA